MGIVLIIIAGFVILGMTQAEVRERWAESRDYRKWLKNRKS